MKSRSIRRSFIAVMLGSIYRHPEVAPRIAGRRAADLISTAPSRPTAAIDAMRPRSHQRNPAGEAASARLKIDARKFDPPGARCHATWLRCRIIPALRTGHLPVYQTLSFGNVGLYGHGVGNRSSPLAFRVGPACPMGGDSVPHAPSLR
jgi:hypothetical protein